MRKRLPLRWTLWPIILVLLLSWSLSVGAEAYTVTLKNGTTFETRYQPVDVDWADDVAMIVTDQGNPIALLKSEIADVSAIAEVKGFGYQLNTTTLFIGWSPNDLVTEDEEGNLVSSYELPDDLPPSPPSFTVEQFVSAPVVGSDGGGIPLFFTAAGDL